MFASQIGGSEFQFQLYFQLQLLANVQLGEHMGDLDGSQPPVLAWKIPLVREGANSQVSSCPQELLLDDFATSLASELSAVRP